MTTWPLGDHLEIHRACLGHRLGHVWGILTGVSGALSEAYLGHVWDMYGTSSEARLGQPLKRACMGHHMEHVWGIILSMYGAVENIRGATCISDADFFKKVV